MATCKLNLPNREQKLRLRHARDYFSLFLFPWIENYTGHIPACNERFLPTLYLQFAFVYLDEVVIFLKFPEAYIRQVRASYRYSARVALLSH